MISFSETEQSFIQQHLHADVTELLLHSKAFPHERMRELVQQIQARQKAKDKLPSWYANPDIVFPSLLSVEQSSSEITAKYKANLVSGNRFADLTGGMGVDFQHISQNSNESFYIERNPQLAELTAHNLGLMGVINAQFLSQDSLTWLSQTDTKFDWIYLDPARRGDANQKVVRLEDCEPNIVQVKDLLFSKTEHILLKASPLLDIDLAIRSLACVAHVHIVAVENEVKEVLFCLQQQSENEATIIATNLTKIDFQQFIFRRSDEQTASFQTGLLGKYLYEPNAAIMKSGAFKLIGERFGLHKIHLHSHLYTSNEKVPNFAGRSFEIDAVVKLDKKELRSYLPSNQANIAIRNFPMTVAQIRQQTGIREGGNIYLFATTDWNDKKIVLVTHKV